MASGYSKAQRNLALEKAAGMLFSVVERINRKTKRLEIFDYDHQHIKNVTGIKHYELKQLLGIR
jgi:hypothetical protein